ncbi:MAG: signal peptide peptidase SppA [Archangium sp.]|nr:signal peptide peptidase SppA [Archangium sp.]
MRFSLLALLVASTSLAQTAGVATDDVSRGTTQLPNSAAFVDDSTSLVLNPAGLGRTGVLTGVVIHERSNTRLLDATGAWVATSLGDFFGLGLGVDFIRPDGGAPRSKTSLGFSLGPQQFSVGATINWLFGTPTSGLIAADLGLQSRPLRWLSLGAAVRNVNAPSSAAATTQREYIVSVGLRPFAERFTLGIDWLAREGVAINTSQLQYTATLRTVPGLRVLAGFSHGLGGAVPLAVQAGLSVDFEHFGYTQGVSVANDRANFQFVGRFSADTYATIVPSRRVIVISLDNIGEPQGSTLGSLLGLAAEDRYLRLLRSLWRASVDPEVDAVVLKVEGASIGLARADEVRAAVERLRQNKKKVVAYVLGASDPEYLIAAACDRIYAAPEAMLMVDGLRSSTIFFGDAAKRLGIDVDVARVGAYKNFPDQFTRADMSAEQKEAVEAYLDTSEKTVASLVMRHRGISQTAWEAIWKEGLKSPQRAKALGEIDDVATPSQLDDLVSGLVPGARIARERSEPRDERWGDQRQIAVIPVLGSITGGRSQSAPVAGQVSGAESFVDAISSAADDPNVVAIVVRVESGGGETLASDVMYRAVIEAKKKKPVVASMGDVAASGGYYVAMGADEIWASPTTLTGSIGVFFIKPAVKRLANEWGIFQQHITRAPLSGVTDPFDPWTEEQREAAQKWVDAFYDTFITEVATNRKMEKTAVDAVARGRVWSGADAKAKGLVDQLGGFMDAVRAAKVRAGLAADDDDVALSFFHARAGLLASVIASAPSSLLERPMPTSPLPPALAHLAEQLGPALWLLDKPAVQSRLEYGLDVR